VFVIALLMVMADLGRLADDAVRIDRLIEQLGSEVFAEREAATKALDRIGEPALKLLRKSSEDSDDAEIRRRAGQLVATIEPRVAEARALAIRRSKISPEEKGRKLKAMVKEGMTHEEVYRLLGMPSGMAALFVGRWFSTPVIGLRSSSINTIKSSRSISYGQSDGEPGPARQPDHRSLSGDSPIWIWEKHNELVLVNHNPAQPLLVPPGRGHLLSPAEGMCLAIVSYLVPPVARHTAPIFGNIADD